MNNERQTATRYERPCNPSHATELRSLSGNRQTGVGKGRERGDAPEWTSPSAGGRHPDTGADTTRDPGWRPVEPAFIALTQIAEGSVQIRAVLAIDVSGQLTYVNRHAEVLTGRSRSELLGKPLSSLFRQSQHARRQGVCGISFQAMEESRRLGPASDWVRAGQDADRRVTECYATPIRDRYGLITGAMIVVGAIFDTGVSFMNLEPFQ